MTVTLFLMTEKGYEVLKDLCRNNFSSNISSVIGSKDENVLNDYYSSIKDICIQYNITFYDRTDSYSTGSDYYIAISWRWMIHNIDSSRLIVLHDSILPKYRGFAPLVNMLINGEEELGVTALFANSEFDKGNIILQKKVSISYPIKIKKAIELVIELYKDIVNDLIADLLVDNGLGSCEQPESLASYSLWLDEDDYKIDWNKSSDYIKRFIDSVGFPYKGAFSTIGGKIVRIYDSEMLDDVLIENRYPGKVLLYNGKSPVVVCGSGLLLLTDIRMENTQEKYYLEKYRIRFS